MATPKCKNLNTKDFEILRKAGIDVGNKEDNNYSESLVNDVFTTLSDNPEF